MIPRSWRRVVPLVLAVSAGLLLAGPVVASLPTPGVVAVGGGVAIVEDTGWLHVFSLADGALRGAVKLPFLIYEVHFDVRRSEFWGETWQDRPVVWSWRPGE